MKSRNYKLYERKQKQKHKGRKKGMWMVRKALEKVKQELDLSPSEYHRLYRGVMCAVLKIRLQRSIRGLVTELQGNKGYRIMCKLTFCPGKSAIHNYLKDLKDLQAKYKDIFEKIVQAMASFVVQGPTIW